jgi:hypothetical protein
MRYIAVVLGLVCALAVAAGEGSSKSDSSSSFFNGKDLAGWEGLMDEWTVKDGAIVGKVPEGQKFNTFLCSKKKYKDFELSFQIRLKDGKGNSGVQIRSELVEPQHYTVKGPQADIGQEYWGSLYGELFGGMMKKSPWDQVSKVLKPDDFNDYSIHCVGKHCTIKLDGVTTVDDDFPKMPDEGIIAWQLHGGMGEFEVTFRNIRFQDLSAGK